MTITSTVKPDGYAKTRSEEPRSPRSPAKTYPAPFETGYASMEDHLEIVMPLCVEEVGVTIE